MLALLQHPDELEKLRENSDLIVNAVEEMLRFDGPVTQTARITMSEREIGGCPIPARQSVLLLLASANHDPEAYPDPHTSMSRVKIHTTTRLEVVRTTDWIDEPSKNGRRIQRRIVPCRCAARRRVAVAHDAPPLATIKASSRTSMCGIHWKNWQ